MTDHIYKYPRIYLNTPFAENGEIMLSADQVHYLRNVLRKSVGDGLRVFNGRDGEWIARIDDLGKKRGCVVLERNILEQPLVDRRVHLYFSPIKKQRMDFLIEKAVELGVTDLYPVLMNRTENRKINTDRMNAQIIEASEQCERMDVPVLHPVVKLRDLSGQDISYPVYVATERSAAAKPVTEYAYDRECAFLVGPEGGFDDDERAIFEQVENVHPVSLGKTILRAETACISCLAYANLSTISEVE